MRKADPGKPWLERAERNLPAEVVPWGRRHRGRPWGRWCRESPWANGWPRDKTPSGRWCRGTEADRGPPGDGLTKVRNLGGRAELKLLRGPSVVKNKPRAMVPSEPLDRGSHRWMMVQEAGVHRGSSDREQRRMDPRCRRDQGTGGGAVEKQPAVEHRSSRNGCGGVGTHGAAGATVVRGRCRRDRTDAR